MMENANADLEKQAKIVPVASTIPQAESTMINDWIKNIQQNDMVNLPSYSAADTCGDGNTAI
jgi:hypothetical protein